MNVVLQMERRAWPSPTLDSDFWQQLCLRQPVPQIFLIHKVLIMADEVYCKMDYLLNRHKFDRHKTLNKLLTTQGKPEGITSRKNTAHDKGAYTTASEEIV